MYNGTENLTQLFKIFFLICFLLTLTRFMLDFGELSVQAPWGVYDLRYNKYIYVI